MKNLFVWSLLFALGCSSTENTVPLLSKDNLGDRSSKIGEKINEESNTVKPQSQTVVIPEYGPTKKETIFKDKTEQYGLKNVQATNVYAVDFDSDGWTDLVVLPEYYSRAAFYHFNPTIKQFQKIDYDLMDEMPKASFLTFADFNHDGVMDLLVGTLYQKTDLLQKALRIYQGSLNPIGQTHYTEIKDAFPGNLWGPASIVLFDFDLDGQLDMFTGNWYDQRVNPMVPVPDHLLKGNILNFTTDVSGSLKNEYKKLKGSKLYPNARPTFGASLCDIDQNGYPDILTVSSGGYPNKLWVSMADQAGNQFFEDYGEESGYAHDSEGGSDLLGGGNGFFSLCADYNNDGIFDIAYGSQFHSYDSENKDHSAVLTGKTREFPPKFIRTPYDINLSGDQWSQSDRRGIWIDYNNDGLMDLIMENSGFPFYTRLVLFEQKPDHSFEDVAEKNGINIMNPSGVVIADFNRDGVMDIIVGQTNTRDARIKPRLYLFENQKKKDGLQSLRVFLRGKQSNIDGLGALLLLKNTKSVMRQMVQYSYGGLPSQNERGILFGVGKERPQKLTVAWPISIKDKLGRESALIQEYSISKLKGKGPWEITVCESGKWLSGRQQSCQ